MLRDIFLEHAAAAGCGSFNSAMVGQEWLAGIGEIAVGRHVEWAAIYPGFATTSHLSDAWVEADCQLCEGRASATARAARAAAAKEAVVQAAGNMTAKDATARMQLLAAMRLPSDIDEQPATQASTIEGLQKQVSAQQQHGGPQQQASEEQIGFSRRASACARRCLQGELSSTKQAATLASEVPTAAQLQPVVDGLISIVQDVAMGVDHDSGAAEHPAVQGIQSLCGTRPMDEDGAMGDAVAAGTEGADGSAATTRAASSRAEGASPRAV